MRVFLYTSFALIAFAFNSILCRLALRGEEVDAVGFTSIRLLSGAITLLLLNWIVNGRPKLAIRKNADSGIYLLAYAFFFSLAYLELTAGIGALILFGSVQVSMLVIAVRRGERPGPTEWLGIVIAFGGLVYLVYPDVASPKLLGAVFMAGAGVAWGLYTLRAKGSKRKKAKREEDDPLVDTTSSFLVAFPFMSLALIESYGDLQVSSYGAVLAVLSGSLTSGIGYVLWYSAVKHHSPSRAAVLQLPVPLLTAVLGILLLGETATVRLFFASVLILGGIALTIFGRSAEARA